MKVYLDNAATTTPDPQVIAVMHEAMQSTFGNPSSLHHAWGRQARALIEAARTTIAGLLNVTPADVTFTGTGTEADNMAIRSAIFGGGVSQVITSRLEHHAVLHTLQTLEREGHIQVSYAGTDEKGRIDYGHLELLLKAKGRSLVSLMQANNEIGTLTDIKRVGRLCQKYDALFHSDTVQTMGHYPLDLQQIPVDYIVGSAHKFHGPKGAGFLYVRPGAPKMPVIHGGAQERNLRGGTENTCGIVGLAKALELACAGMGEHRKHLQALKDYLAGQLLKAVPGITFKGEIDPGASLYTVLNVSFPESAGELLLYQLDAVGIAASGGSACSSASEERSHVLAAIGADPKRPAVRFSFSKYNTKAEVDYVVAQIRSMIQ